MKAGHEPITVWLAQSPRLDDASFLRHEVYRHHQGSVLFTALKAQVLVEKAARQGTSPDFSQTAQVPLVLYHVRKRRALTAEPSLGDQGLEEGDVLVPVFGEVPVHPLLEMLEAQRFPPKVSGNVPRHKTTLTLADVESSMASPSPMTTILFLSADPAKTTRLRLGEEVREIQGKLQLARLREYFRFEQRWAARPTDIAQALLDLRPRIVHFSGHGTARGKLCFENAVGRVQPVTAGALSALFEQFSDHVDCVLLNACYSQRQAEAIAQHVPHVIGMKREISDKAAIAFATGFYQALGGERSIEDAFKLGCVQIQLWGIPEHLTPTLIRR